VRSLILLASLFLALTGIPRTAFPAPAVEETGQLLVRVKDHREAIGDFERLAIGIASIRIKQNSGLKFFRSGWIDLTPQLNSVDLTQYSGSRSALVLSSKVPAGGFEGFELKLSGVEGVLKRGQPAVGVKNTLGPLALRFTVSPDTTTLIVLDLAILDLRDHPPRGYELQLKGYAVRQNGKLVEKVPPG
jgi:hypothetical protein